MAFGGGKRSTPGVSWSVDIQPQMETFPNSSSAKEVLELRKGLANLTKMHKIATAKMDGLRDEKLALKSQLSAKDKHASLLKRKVASLQIECETLERERETEKAHMSKLEAKVGAMSNTADVLEKYGNVKRRCRDLRDENAALKARLQQCAEDQASQTHEINTMQAALRLKAAEISEETGKDIPTRLLYAIARSREDGVVLAIQLTDEKEKNRKCAMEIESLKHKLQESEDARTDLLVALKQKDRRVVSAESANKSLQDTVERMEHEISQVEASNEEMRSVNDGLESELAQREQSIQQLHDLVRDNEIASSTREKELRAELVGALEREAAFAAQERKKASDQRLMLERKATSLEAEVKDYNFKVQEMQLENDRLKTDKQELQQRMQEIVLHADSKENGLREDMQALDGHCTALHERANGLAEEVSSARAEAAAYASRVDLASKRAQQAEQALSQQEERWRDDRAALTHKLEDALLQFNNAIEKSDRAEREAAALRTEAGIKDSKMQQLVNEMTNIRESNNALFRSKELLQKAMLDQVSEVRVRLDAANMHSKELEATVYKQRENERFLKQRLETEQRSRFDQASGQAHQVFSTSTTPAPFAPTAAPMPMTVHTELRGSFQKDDAQAGPRINHPSLEQLAGIDRDVMSRLQTPQSIMK